MGSGSFATRFTRANLGGHYLSAQSLGLTPPGAVFGNQRLSVGVWPGL